jgi:hypothetical protein
VRRAAAHRLRRRGRRRHHGRIERHLGSFADTAENIVRLLGAIDRPNVALSYQVLDFCRWTTRGAAGRRRAPGAARLLLTSRTTSPTRGGRPDVPGGGLATGPRLPRPILTAAVARLSRPFTIEFLAADERRSRRSSPTPPSWRVLAGLDAE